MDVVNWFLDPNNWQGTSGIPNRLFEHLALAAVALVTATIIALPFGLYVGHTGRWANLMINVANVGRAIPSYAILVIILPISLSVSPDLGLNLDPDVHRDGAPGGPADPGQHLRRAPGGGPRPRRGRTRDGLPRAPDPRDLEVPIAMPVIVGGFRTATLQVIATATIGAVVGGGGLGRFIVDGFHNPGQPAQLFGGVILVAGLAIGVDLIFALIQRRITPPALRGDMSDRREDIAVPTAAAGVT